MARLIRFFFVLILTGGSVWGQRPNIIINPGPGGVTRLAVASFTARADPTAETNTAVATFNEVLWNDLRFSAFFEMPSRSFYPLTPIQLPRDVTFEEWSVPSLNADFVAFGNLQVYSTAVVVEAYLFDVKTTDQVIGKRYTVGESTAIRDVSHQVADEIVFQLSSGASRGVAQTRIAFSRDQTGSKEIYTMAYDGEDLRTITANRGLNKFPRWSTDNTKLAFVTNLPGSNQWQLWLQDLAGGRVVLDTPSHYVSAPAISPEGNRLVYSSRQESQIDSDLFVANISGQGRRNITNHPAIDTSPTWSPSGQQIAFISDRSRTPQLWMMEADGSNLRRLVEEGGHCDNPSWSPDGRYIVYSWQAPRQWKHDIYIVEVASGRIFQLTSRLGSNESPAWSPDGRHIAFQSDRSGTKQIFIMNADGKNLKQVTAYGINGSPAWSSYYSAER